MSIRLTLRNRFHAARARLFVELLRPVEGARLLDLGGAEGSLAARICAHVPLDVTVADTSADHRAAVLDRGFRHVLLDEAQPLPFEPGEFDVVLCNSVIEHVTLPKERCSVHARVDEAEWRSESRASQQRFARQIMQLATSYFVQTPHRHFPIEQHVHAPFVQYLSHNNQCRVVAVTDRWWIKSCGGIVDWSLLTTNEMAELFPDADIRVEWLVGLPKSIIAWRRGPRPSSES
jgi:hypothetical protein